MPINEVPYILFISFSLFQYPVIILLSSYISFMCSSISFVCSLHNACFLRHYLYNNRLLFISARLRITIYLIFYNNLIYLYILFTRVAFVPLQYRNIHKKSIKLRRIKKKKTTICTSMQGYFSTISRDEVVVCLPIYFQPRYTLTTHCLMLEITFTIQ